MKNSDEFYMQIALQEARAAARRGEIPVGAVLVIDDQVIAKGGNQREKKQDPTAHAEIIALSRAGKKLKNWRLKQARVYVTKEPCPMCAGALLQARVAEVIFGAFDPELGAAGSVINLLDYPGFSAYTLVRGGILQKECEQLLQNFFAGQRKPTNSRN